ncbi:hypothetical protein B0H14DRAFT_2967257 [Mycena olivaceomarginata]|nr:hypothetical protein B0H14DRAFT_2967257 [Mycena olivaceomarginata]
MPSTTFKFQLSLAGACLFFFHPRPVPAVTTLSVPPIFLPLSSALPAVVLGVDSQGTDHGTTKTTPLTGTLVQGADHAGYTFSAWRPATLSSLEPFAIDVVSTAAPSATGKPSSALPRLSASLSGALVGVVVLAAHSLV